MCKSCSALNAAAPARAPARSRPRAPRQPTRDANLGHPIIPSYVLCHPLSQAPEREKSAALRGFHGLIESRQGDSNSRPIITKIRSELKKPLQRSSLDPNVGRGPALNPPTAAGPLSEMRKAQLRAPLCKGAFCEHRAKFLE